MYYLRDNFDRIALFVLLSAALAACNSRRREVILYPVDSLVTAQVNLLSGARARLHKQATLGFDIDTVMTVPDSMAWADELNIFRQLDLINKPVNVGSYRITDGEADTESNLMVKAFESREDHPVRYLRVFYDGSLDKPRRIEAHYLEENALFRSSRFLSMEFQQLDNKTALTSYSMEGSQKMMLKDSIKFSVRGKIQFN